MKNIRKGFTLVELVIVLVIIAILGSIAFVAYSALIKKSKANSAKTTAQSVDHEAVALAASDNAPADASYINKVLGDSANGFTQTTAPTGTVAGAWTKGATDPVTVVQSAAASDSYTFTKGGQSVCYTPSANVAQTVAITDGACA